MALDMTILLPFLSSLLMFLAYLVPHAYLQFIPSCTSDLVSGLTFLLTPLSLCLPSVSVFGGQNKDVPLPMVKSVGDGAS